MFCNNCGIELPDGSKFCMNCGAKLITVNIANTHGNNNVVNETQINNVDEKIVKEFHLFGGKVKINEKVNNTAEIRKVFKRYSLEAEKEIESQYYLLGNMIEVSNQLPTIGLSMLENYINKCIEILIQNKIYNIDSEVFKEKYYNIATIWNKECQNALSDFIDIMMEFQQKKDSHDEWASSQGNWVGGGFGLEGAIKGAAQSMALNIATDLVAGAIGAGANAISKNQAMKKLDEAYNEYRTVEKFKKAIHKSVFDMNIALIQSMIENGSTDYYVIGDEQENAKRILNNIRVIQDKEETLLKLLNSFPFSTDAINFAFENDIGNKDEIIAYANYLELDIIPIMRITQVEKMIIETDYNDLKTMETTKSEVAQLCLKYQIDDKKYLEFLNKEIEIITKKLLVFDNVEYSTVDESLRAQKTLFDVIDNVSNIDENDREKISACINTLEDSNIKSKQKYLDFLNRKLQEANTNAKSVFGIELDNEQMANEALKQCQIVYDTFSNEIFDSVLNLSQFKNYIENNLDNRISIGYLNRIDDLINIFNESMSYCKKYDRYHFTNRWEYTNAVVEGEKIQVLLNSFNLINDEFDKVFVRLKKDYVNVFGIEYSSIDIAIEKYVNLVNHAKAYKKSQDEKRESKNKGFFNSLKAGVSSALNSRYETDYLRVTNNGTISIPDDIPFELNQMTDMIGKSKEQAKNIEASIRQNKLNNPTDIKVTKLDMSNLLCCCNDETLGNQIEQIKGIVNGTVIMIEVTEKSNLSSQDEIVKHLKLMNEYYYENKDNVTIVQDLKQGKVNYIISYKYLIELESSIGYLKSQNIIVNFV